MEAVVEQVIRAGFMWKIRCEQPLEKGEGTTKELRETRSPGRGAVGLLTVMISHFYFDDFVSLSPSAGCNLQEGKHHSCFVPFSLQQLV